MEDSVMMMTNSTNIKPMKTETENKEEIINSKGRKECKRRRKNHTKKTYKCTTNQFTDQNSNLYVQQDTLSFLVSGYEIP
jgi:hypothetical protein